MNIKELKELIKNCPDNMFVLGPSSDHSYRELDAEITTALNSRYDWTEDFGEEVTSEKDYGKRVGVLVLS